MKKRDIVARVRALIALAVDPNSSEAESRTAALAACRLIATHDLTISFPEDARKRRPSDLIDSILDRGPREPRPPRPPRPPRTPQQVRPNVRDK